MEGLGDPMRQQQETEFTGTLWTREGRVLAKIIRGLFEPPEAGELCWRGHMSVDGFSTDSIFGIESLIVRRHGCGGTPIRVCTSQVVRGQIRFWCEHPIEPGPVTLTRDLGDGDRARPATVGREPGRLPGDMNQ